MSLQNGKTIWDIGEFSVCGGAVMSLEPEVRKKLQKQIDELRRRMQYDANDLDYETHLHQVRDLQRILDKT
jgi:hypothetical protein